MKVAYLGPEGSYTGVAARKIFPHADLVHVQPIRSVVEAVEKGELDFGVVPGENFYETEVTKTLDALREAKQTRIVGEMPLQIHHAIGALPGAKITRILSHPQAINQCERYLLKTYPGATHQYADSTSDAVNKVADGKLTDTAAIASAETLGKRLEVLATDICPNNRTRFFQIGKTNTNPTGRDKTFLSIHPQMRDRAGILAPIVNILAAMHINEEFIQSRADGLGGYYFYIEIDGHRLERRVSKAFEAIRESLDPHEKNPELIHIMGSYADSRWKTCELT